MDERQSVFAELEAARERAAGLLRAKLEAVAAQIREAAARAAGDLEVVVPPDLEILLPLTPAGRLLAAPPPPAPSPSVAIEAVRRLDTGRAQSEVLKEFLAQLEGFCGPRAILVFRDGEVIGWSSVGFRDDTAVRSWRGRIADSAAFAAVAEGTPVVADAADDALLGGLMGDCSGRALLVPMSLRGKIVGAALAGEDGGELAIDVVQIFTYMTGLLLETLAVRPVVPTPALVEPLVLASTGGPAVAPAVDIVEAGLVAAAAEESAAARVPVVGVAAEPAVEPEPLPEEVASRAVEVPVAPPAVALRSPEDEQKHGEAQRFARLLVSEIRLYNEQAVQEGRASRDIYQRLKEDIDRSREMYEQRVPAEVRAASNYFFEELVRILADGDPDALGL